MLSKGIFHRNVVDVISDALDIWPGGLTVINFSILKILKTYSNNVLLN